MKFLVTSLVTALLMTYAVAVQSQQAGDQSGIPAEEYAIYAAVIGNIFAGNKATFNSQPTFKLLVIEDWTVKNFFSSNSEGG